MAYLNDNFIKNVSKRVEDCSSVSQLRGCLNRYRTYVFSSELKKVFMERISFIREYHIGDQMVQNQCEDLTDDLEIEVQISQICRTSLMTGDQGSEARINPEVVDFHCYSYNTDEELNALKRIFEYFNGNKLDICRYLSVTNENLNNKINQYKLKAYLNTVRRDFRNNLGTRMRY